MFVMSEEEEGRCSAEHDMATEVRQKRQLAKVRPENHSFSDPYSFHSGVASLILPACASLLFVACFLHRRKIMWPVFCTGLRRRKSLAVSRSC